LFGGLARRYAFLAPHPISAAWICPCVAVSSRNVSPMFPPGRVSGGNATTPPPIHAAAEQEQTAPPTWAANVFPVAVAPGKRMKYRQT